MRSEAFSADGYIIDQSKTDDVPYGVFPSSYNGCGWIAVFNLYKATGNPQPPLSVRDALIAGSPFSGRLGTGPRRLARFLRDSGFSITTALRRKKVIQLAPQSAAGILFYIPKDGPHYTCYVRQPNGLLRFLNAIEGEEAHISTMEELLKTQATPLPIYLMALDGSL